MKVAFQVPIKSLPSERVKNKNFRDFCGKPFFCWHLDQLNKLPTHWDIYIDSDDEKVFELVKKKYSRFKFHKRDKWYASNDSNGNHLINQFVVKNNQYDIICQTFVTAIFLNYKTIKQCVEALIDSRNIYDSAFLATKETGWVWFENSPVNYRHDVMNGLPRSQDAVYYKETTGLYASFRENILKTGCRIGEKPLVYQVEKIQAFDIDNEEDLFEAEKIIKSRKNNV